MKLTRHIFLVISLCFSLHLVSTAQESLYPKVEIMNTELRGIYSDITFENYAINVFLPKSYDKSSSKKYPVVFVLDAQYNFGMVSYATRRLIKDELIPEVILVGISYRANYSTYINNRQRDYTPTRTNLPFTGGGEKFLDFLDKELIPFIENEYAVSEDRTICGHSLGGLIGFHSFLTSNIFRRYLLVSPSLWYDDKRIFHTANQNLAQLNTKSSKIYTAIGELETIKTGQVHDMVKDLDGFVKKLKSNSISNLKFEVLDNETHRTVFPRAFSNGMRYLFAE
jgi:predicted alpha/beta superfamily hydrolase